MCCTTRCVTLRSLDTRAQPHRLTRQEVPRWIADLVVDLAARLGLDLQIPQTPMEGHEDLAEAIRPLLRAKGQGRATLGAQIGRPRRHVAYRSTWRCAMFGELTPDQIEHVLYLESIGRVGCHAAGQTYVVPVSYVYDGEAIHTYSYEGMKLRMMRKNPKRLLPSRRYRQPF